MSLLLRLTVPLAVLFLAQGMHAEAKSLINNAHEIAMQLGSRTMILDATLLLCEYYLEQKEILLFTRYIEKAATGLDENLITSYSGYHDLLIGRFHIIQEEYETADKVLRSALATFEKREEQFNIARTYTYLGLCAKQRKDADFQPSENDAQDVSGSGVFGRQVQRGRAASHALRSLGALG